MKRVGNLWSGLTSFENLLHSAQLAAAGKRSRPDVAAFWLDLEPNLLLLRRQLMEGSYETGTYSHFPIRDPKPRMISAAPFRDRVVHHALTSVLEPVFEKRFSPNSFACRKGLGTHKAIAKAKTAMAANRYCLKCDIRKYFDSIDHLILQQALARVVKCKPTLALADRIIASFGVREASVATGYFDGDDLFTALDRPRGLPLGNQTSQFFANVYLHSVDLLMDLELGCARTYARYVDDLVVFDDSKQRLSEIRARLQQEVEKLRLRLHPGKSRVYRCVDGVRFLGWSLRASDGAIVSRLARENVVRAQRRFRHLQEDFHAGHLEWDTVASSLGAWIAHASHGQTFGLRRALLGRYGFRLGVRLQLCGAGRSTTMNGGSAARTATGTNLTTGTTTWGFE